MYQNRRGLGGGSRALLLGSGGEGCPAGSRLADRNARQRAVESPAIQTIEHFQGQIGFVAIV